MTATGVLAVALFVAVAALGFLAIEWNYQRKMHALHREAYEKSYVAHGRTLELWGETIADFKALERERST